MEYAALRRRISDVEKGASKARRDDRRAETVESLRQLKPGDVIEVPTGKFAGYAVVVDPGWSPEGPRPFVVTLEKQARRLAMIDFPEPVEALTRLKVSRSFNAAQPADASRPGRPAADAHPRPAARHLRRARRQAPGRAHAGEPSAWESEVTDLRRQLKAHPCHECPEREDHSRWSERHFKLDRDAATLARRVEQRTNTVARQFDRVCEVLTALGYLSDDGADAVVTDQGKHLMRLYSDMDLVAAESLRLGVWDDLTPSELAAALSTLVFEARRPDDASSPRVPGGGAKKAIGAMVRLWGDLDRLEKDHKLDYLRQPDLGFAWIAYRWCEGDDLDDVLGESELAAGDFVRWMKQVLDLAGQVAEAAGDSPVRRSARDAIDAMRRGVVAASGLTEE